MWVTRSWSAYGFALLLLALTYETRAQPRFQGLGDLPGSTFESAASGVSGDGSVIVGTGKSAYNTGYEAFRWTRATGMQAMGNLSNSPGVAQSWGYAVSANGQVITGMSQRITGGGEAYRWTAGTGMVGLGDLPGGWFESYAGKMSADGSVIGGSGVSEDANGARWEAFRWTAATGLVGLGDLPGGKFESAVYSVSADGTVIVGAGTSALGVEAFRWTQATGMVSLGDFAGGTTLSRTRDVSADGSVIVGFGNTAAGQEAFRWTAAGGMLGLGDLPGGTQSSSAEGVSGDGSVVVGYSRTDVGLEAFVWDEARGMRNLKDVLVNDYGLDLTGWTLMNATEISLDGSTIVGVGTNPSGDQEAWVATLPEPGCGLLMCASLLLLRRRAVR